MRALRSLLAFSIALIITLGVSFGGIAQEETESADDAGAQQTEIAPVMLDGDTLFQIQTGLSRLSPEERAKNIRQQIVDTARNAAISVESFEIVDENSRLIILSNQLETEIEILTVTQVDAEAIGIPQQQLAEEYLQTLKAAIIQYRQSRTAGYLLRAGIYSFITTLAFLLLLIAFGFLFLRFYRAFENWGATRIPDIRIRGIQLLTANRIISILLQILKAIRFIIVASLVIAYVALILSFFPWTRQVASLLHSYALSALVNTWAAFINYIPNLLTLFLIVVITIYLLRLIKPLFVEINRGSLTIPGFYTEWANPTYRIIELLIFALAAVVMFPYLPGFGSQAFQGVGIFLGVLVSLGSSSAIANAISGVILIYTRAFQIGDTIRVNDIEGEVDEKLFLVTRIRTFDNYLVTIPNGLLLSGNIINYNSSIRETRTPIMVPQDVTLGYQIPWRQVYEILVEAALSSEFVLEEPVPFVHHIALGNSYVTYRLFAYTRYPREMERINAGLLRNIHDKCYEAGIEILSPTYSAVRDGNASTLPESSLPDNYAAPGFKVNPSGNLFQIDLKMGPNNRGQISRRKPDRGGFE